MPKAATSSVLIATTGALLAACMSSHATGDGTVPGGHEGEPTIHAAQRHFTAHDNGRYILLQRGHAAELIVGDPQAPDPHVEGGAVELIATSNISASGRRAWEIRARTAGVSRITVAGQTPFTLTIEVPAE